mgnify:CR=1 FL=1
MRDFDALTYVPDSPSLSISLFEMLAYVIA